MSQEGQNKGNIIIQTPFQKGEKNLEILSDSYEEKSQKEQDVKWQKNSGKQNNSRKPLLLFKLSDLQILMLQCESFFASCFAFHFSSCRIFLVLSASLCHWERKNTGFSADLDPSSYSEFYQVFLFIHSLCELQHSLTRKLMAICRKYFHRILHHMCPEKSRLECLYV